MLSLSARTRSATTIVTILFLFLGAYTSLEAQEVLSTHPGARGGTMGSIRSIHTDVLAMYGNEAGLGFATNLSFYASAERRANNEGLNFYSLASCLPTAFGSFGVLIEHFGFDLYNEQLVGLGYGRQVSEYLSVGAQFDYLQVKIPSYGQKSAVTVELGLLTKIGTRTQLGFHVYNPFDIRLVEEEPLPTIINLGVAYQPTHQVRVIAEVEKVGGQQENLKAGLEYQLVERFTFRLGVNTNPSLITFGVGYQMQNGMSLDVGSTVHQLLGISPLAGIGYQRTKSP